MDFAHNCVLVTGGSGFIGSHLVAELLDYGAEVHVLDNMSSGCQTHLPPGVTLHQVDLRNSDLETLLTEVSPDAIAHLAAVHFIPYCNDHPEETFDTNVIGTRRLLEAARGIEVDALLYSSSAAVYPPRDGKHSETNTVGPTDIYGRTKLVGEDIVRLYAEDTGISTTSARLFNVYGPNETNPHLIPDVLEQLSPENGEMTLGNLAPKRDFVHVTDVACALRLLLSQEDEYTVCNVGTGTEQSVLEVAELAVELSPYDISVAQSDARMRETDRPHLQADISRIRELVGWEPEVSFSEGLSRLVEARVEGA